jgi:hypothetical protein
MSNLYGRRWLDQRWSVCTAVCTLQLLAAQFRARRTTSCNISSKLMAKLHDNYQRDPHGDAAG